MTKKISKKLIAIILCFAMVLPLGVSADTLEDLEAEQADLQNRMSEIEGTISSLENDKSQAQAHQDALEEKMDLLEEKIDTSRKNLKTLTGEIKTLEEKIDSAEGEYDKSMEKLKERIKALYQVGDVGTIEILLNSTSLYDFSMKTETIKSVTERDKQLMDEIRGYLVATKADRDSLKQRKDAEARIKKQLDADQEELQETQEENESLIASLQGEIGEKETQLANIEEEDAELNDKIAALVAQKKKEEEEARKREEEEARLREEQARKDAEANQDSGSGDNSDVETPTPDTSGSTGGDGAGMSDGFDPRWPLPGYDTSWITCWYGDGGHNGLDIAGNYGAEIVAAQAGQVLSAEYHYSWGNNVLLYHNGTYQTRYAHMSDMAVSSGQYVERGQVIGYVGSTGNSTGNHLHFEVYLNGSRVDPYGYL